MRFVSLISRLSVIALGAACTGVVACSGTSDGGTGDPIHKPVPSEYGDGEKISDVVGDATWLQAGKMDTAGCESPGDAPVNLTGQVIVAVDTYDETNAGQTGNIYIEDVPVPGAAPVPYSGITVFGASFTPPDLRIFEGDVMDTFGSISEFLGPSTPFGGCKSLPEVTGNLTFRFENGFRDPITIVQGGSDPARFDPIKGYPKARQWLGMLVKIEGVVLPNPPVCQGCPGSDCTACDDDWQGRFSYDLDVGGGISGADVITVDNELFDLKQDGPQITAPAQFKSITGVMTYFYNFHIAPRSAADFEQ